MGKRLVEHQRLTVYIYSTLIVAVGIPLDFPGWTGPKNEFHATHNTAQLIGTVSIFTEYRLYRIL